MSGVGELFFFCGKMGAGKSTLSKKMAKDENAVRISEDEWLESLYPQQIKNFDDYLALSAQMKPLVKSHVQQILLTGTNVVMDFPANTIKQRQWFLALVNEIQAQHTLLFLNLDDAECLAHLALRREQEPERAAFDTEAMFMHVSQYFQVPRSDEGLNIISP